MRLIDADVFRGKVCGWFHKDIQESNQVDDLAASVIMEIDAAPTVEAAPVVRGYWIDKGMDGDWAWQTDGRGSHWNVYECSACKCRSPRDVNFCPNCGAKMQ